MHGGHQYSRLAVGLGIVALAALLGCGGVSDTPGGLTDVDNILTNTNDPGTTGGTGGTVPDNGAAAAFDLAPRLGEAPLEVTATVLDAADGAGYAWDLGDGTLLAGASVSHTYVGPGLYEVLLGRQTAAGSDLLAADTVAVIPDFSIATSTDDATGEITFWVAPDPVVSPLPVDGEFTWVLGDGTSAAGREIRHVYSQAGRYTVVLSFVTVLSSVQCAQLVKEAGDPPDQERGLSVSSLVVTPADGFTAVGEMGGPFTPASKTYTLKNDGAKPLVWSATVTAEWVSLTPPTGTLAAGESVVMTAALNDQANDRPWGQHDAQLKVRNLTVDEVAAQCDLRLSVEAVRPLIAALGDEGAEPDADYARTPTLLAGTLPVTWTLVAGPAGMTMDAGTGAVVWPAPHTPGDDVTVTIRAENLGGADEESWQVLVGAAAPRLAALGDDAVDPGVAYSRTPTLLAGTPPVTWTLQQGPAGMTINSGTGVVSWSDPQPADSTHPITIRATNAAGYDEGSWVLAVTEDDPPVIAALADDEVEPDAAYGRTPSLSQGTPPVTWSLVAGPAGMTMDAGTGQVSWPGPHTPNETHTVTIRATNAAGSDDASFALYVRPALASSLSQYGITWTFDKPYRVGQFVNGDWWVTPDTPGGTVTVVTVDPAPTGSGESYRNGSMVNPVPGATHGYDGRSGAFDQNDAEVYPLALGNEQSLVSAVSRPEDADFNASTGHRGKISDAAILTCLTTYPSPTSFRPAYCGDSKTIYDAAGIDLGLLPDLVSVAATPALSSLYDGTYAVGGTESGYIDFSKPWLDHVVDYYNQHIHPQNHMEDYGRDIARHIGDALLMLCLDDVGDRTALARHVCQLGIDLYGISQAGGYWPNNGGHNAGRKAPIVVAGWLLGDNGMRDIGTTVQFQEDQQTFHIAQADVDRLLDTEVSMTVSASTSNTVTGTLNRALDGYAIITEGNLRVTGGNGVGQERVISSSTQTRGTTLNVGASLTLTCDTPWTTQPSVGGTVAILGYEVADIGMAEWGINHASNIVRDNPAWSADYRYTNGYCWPGMVLAVRIMRLKPSWGHDALFDYQDRYMDITDDDGAFPGTRALSPFAENMWDTYRNDY